MPAFNFQKQFAAAVARGEKTQTIRAHRKDGRVPAKVGDTLALYTGMRHPSCRKLLDAECTAVRSVTIDHFSVIHGAQKILGCPLNVFAQADGFEDWHAMHGWFEETHGLPFEGWLIQWRPTGGGA